MLNPYASTSAETSEAIVRPTIHPDWKWMAIATYALFCFCMLGMVGKTNPPNSSVVGFGHGVVRLNALVGDVAFYCLIPLLALLPSSVAAVVFRRIYRTSDPESSSTGINFAFLVVGLLMAVVNASCYRGDGTQSGG